MTPDMRPAVEHPPYFTRVTGPADTTIPAYSPDKVHRVTRDMHGYTNCTSNDYVPTYDNKKPQRVHPFAKFMRRPKHSRNSS